MGILEHQALRWPRDMEELSVTYNQQIVAAHYGASEVMPTDTGVTQVYVLLRDVREVRPPTIGQWQGAPPLEITPVVEFPLETNFVKEVLAKTRMERKLLQEALQLIKRYHAGTQCATEEPSYLHAISVANILLEHTQEGCCMIPSIRHVSLGSTLLCASVLS